MDFQNGLASAHIRQVHRDAAVKTSRTQQRRIKNIRAICRGDDNDSFLRVEAVHLDKQRIQSLLALVIAAAETDTTAATDRVNFINKNQARNVFTRLLEH